MHEDDSALFSSDTFQRYIERMANMQGERVGMIESLERAINENPNIKRGMVELQEKLYQDPAACSRLGVKVAKIVMALDLEETFEDEQDTDDMDEDFDIE